jgi:hypothetical protein
MLVEIRQRHFASQPRLQGWFTPFGACHVGNHLARIEDFGYCLKVCPVEAVTLFAQHLGKTRFGRRRSSSLSCSILAAGVFEVLCFGIRVSAAIESLTAKL